MNELREVVGKFGVREVVKPKALADTNFHLIKFILLMLKVHSFLTTHNLKFRHLRISINSATNITSFQS